MPKFIHIPSGVTPFSFGNALDFDGNNDRITANDLAIAGASTTGITASVWLKPDTITSTDNPIVFATAASSNNLFGLQIRGSSGNGYMRVFARNGANTTIEFANALTSTNWSHVFIVYDGTQSTTINRVKMWVNGVSVPASTGYNGDAPSSLDTSDLSNFNIGVWPSQTGFAPVYYLGLMDELAIWTDHVGTATDAVNLYNSGNGALATDVIASPERYYRLDESGTATTTVDASGNGNTGTLLNFTSPPDYWVTH
jgi:hypothetical protein